MLKVVYQIGDMWEEKRGSRKIWYVQFPKGREGFNRKASALAWQKILKKEYGKEK